MNVHPSGYYAWKAEPASPRARTMNDCKVESFNGRFREECLNANGRFGDAFLAGADGRLPLMSPSRGHMTFSHRFD
jgi:hypothetical protein